MATDLQPVRQPMPKPPAGTKYDRFVEKQLGRARRRIRGLDVAAGGLGLFILTLAYGLVMSVGDRWLEFSALARQLAFATYLVSAVAYVGLVIIWPMFLRVNPYYAARQLEQTVPDAKNSVVNWLDLHALALPAAMRSAIGRKAAADLAQVEVDQAISVRRVSWLSGVFGGLLLAFL